MIFGAKIQTYVSQKTIDEKKIWNNEFNKSFFKRELAKRLAAPPVTSADRLGALLKNRKEVLLERSWGLVALVFGTLLDFLDLKSTC